MLMEHVLLGERYKVETAASVRGARTLLGRHGYDLVIADARLPDGSGMAVAEEAQQHGIQALIITGYALSIPPQELGRFEYLLKPVRPSELVEAVERMLDGASKECDADSR